MNNQHVKQLIDRMLIQPLSSEEELYLFEQLEKYPELQDHYQKTVKLHEELQVLHEEEPYKETELIHARTQLFNEIDTVKREYHIIKYAAAVLIGVIFSYSFMYINTSEPYEHVTSLDVQQLDNNKILLTGQRVSEFEMKGSVKDQKIQNLLIQFLRTNPNVGHKFSAMDALSNIKDDRKELIDTYIQLANEEPNLGLRLKAIQNLSYYIDLKHVQSALITLLKTETNDIIKNAVFDALNTLHSDQLDLNKESIQTFDSRLINQKKFKKGN